MLINKLEKNSWVMIEKRSMRRCGSKILPLLAFAKNRKLDDFSAVCCEILHSFVMLINKRTLPACVILPIHCFPKQNVRHNSESVPINEKKHREYTKLDTQFNARQQHSYTHVYLVLQTCADK